MKRAVAGTVCRGTENTIPKESSANTSISFIFDRRFIKLGIPLPGTHLAFVGTVARQNIPTTNAFITDLIWALVTVASVVLAIILVGLLRAPSPQTNAGFGTLLVLKPEARTF